MFLSIHIQNQTFKDNLCITWTVAQVIKKLKKLKSCITELTAVDATVSINTKVIYLYVTDDGCRSDLDYRLKSCHCCVVIPPGNKPI